MKINDILTESQIQELTEGPVLNKIGKGIGKAVGGVAKGIGAVAGGVVGAGQALKKGYQAGKSAVSGDEQEPQSQTNPKPAKTVSPATTTTVAPKTKPAPVADKPSVPAGKTATPPAPASAPAAQPTDTAYAQAQQAVTKLQPAQRKEILDLLTKDPKVQAKLNAQKKQVKKPAPMSKFGKLVKAAGI